MIYVEDVSGEICVRGTRQHRKRGGKSERGGSEPPHQVSRGENSLRHFEEKQPLHMSAAKQKTACSPGNSGQKSACPQHHQRRKPLFAGVI